MVGSESGGVMSHHTETRAFNLVPQYILNEKVRTVSAQLALNLEKLLNNLLELGHGLCKSATLEDIRKHGHVLTPGRYIGSEAQEDDGDLFGEKMKHLAAQLHEQCGGSDIVEKIIKRNLKVLKYGGQ